SVVSPTPQYLNRLVFFDFENDTHNAKTKAFVDALMGPNIGTSGCPERTIDDPDPSALDAAPDGKVHGLRNCQEGQWLRQRNPNTVFTWEHYDFYRASRPFLAAFVKHRREDLFLALAESVWRHFPGPDATEAECGLPGGGMCPRDNGVSYEALV